MILCVFMFWLSGIAHSTMYVEVELLVEFSAIGEHFYVMTEVLSSSTLYIMYLVFFVVVVNTAKCKQMNKKLFVTFAFNSILYTFDAWTEMRAKQIKFSQIIEKKTE